MDDDGMDSLFSSFMNEVSSIKTAKMKKMESNQGTPEEIIERILARPYDPKQGQGSAYQILQVAPDAETNEITKQYRRLSVLVHPDKCKLERAAEAFQVIVKAYNDTKDPNYQDKYADVIIEAKKKVRKQREKENEVREKKGEDPLPTDGGEFDRAVWEECERMTSSATEAAEAANSVAEANKKRYEEQARERRERKKAEHKELREWERNKDKRAAGWQVFMQNVQAKKFKAGHTVGKIGAADQYHKREERKDTDKKAEVDLEDKKVVRSDMQAAFVDMSGTQSISSAKILVNHQVRRRQQLSVALKAWELLAQNLAQEAMGVLGKDAELTDALSLTLRAEALLRQNRLEEAAEDCAQALGIFPSSLTRLVQAEVSLRLGYLADCVEECNRVLELEPQPAAFALRAEARLHLGQLEEAVLDCDWALAQGHRSAAVFAVRGNASRKMGSLREAIRDADEALRESPSFAEALVLRGQALLEQRDACAAMTDLTKAIEMVAPREVHAAALASRADALARRTQTDQSSPVFKVALRRYDEERDPKGRSLANSRATAEILFFGLHRRSWTPLDSPSAQKS
ncbi:unnamed protein product [Effrenium voratum]|uniref:J domain-containing protein n=1 Tax=Effrenium voratum TaxID=2562239 RepID=A0AA36N5V3_9DINO|nr:unnamed protein product [Effrenium voratum]